MLTRHATTEDIPEIVRIINSAFRVEDFFIDGDRTNEADIAARMAEPDVRFLVVDAPESGTLPFPDERKLRRDAHLVRMTKRLNASDPV